MKKPTAKNFKDETGKKFGHWTVVSYSHSKHGAYFNCVCTCGTKRVLAGNFLRFGLTTHCGCSRKRLFVDETGKRYGMLLVLRYSHKDCQGCAHFLCRCDCGKEKTYWGFSLRSGLSTNCGCLQYHGMSGTPEYDALAHAKSRCFNRNGKAWEYYGGRGITVFEGWLGKGGFQRFFAYVGKRPSPEHSLDRIDPNGNYEPGNVRWGTEMMQRMNQRRVLEAVFQKEEAEYWEGQGASVDSEAHLRTLADTNDF